MGPTESQPTGFDTETLARIVRSTPDCELAEGVRRNRDVLIGEVFRRFPERLSASGRRANAVIKWKIGGREDGDGYDRWFLVIRNGTCEIGKDLDLEPRVTLQLGPLEFLKVVTGNANPVELFLRRKLKVKGNLLYAARLQRLFTAPGQ